MRRLFVLLREAAVAEDVGTEYRGELPLHLFALGGAVKGSLSPAVRRSAKSVDSLGAANLSVPPPLLFRREPPGLRRGTFFRGLSSQWTIKPTKAAPATVHSHCK
jgi:hypothetical protein